MYEGGYAFLLRFIESAQFKLFHCISYLERYSDELGIHFHLCQKLRLYPDDEIEFFIPQLVQLQVTVKTESMALEDLLVDLCTRSVHSAVLIFWQVQAHLAGLASEPESYGFQVCQRLMAKLQHVLFDVGSPPEDKIRENCAPAMILASSLAGAIGLPGMINHIQPLVVSQGRKHRSHIFQIANKAVAGALGHSRTSSRASSFMSMRSRSTTLINSDGEEEYTSLPSPMSTRSFSFSSSTQTLYSGESETRSLPNLAMGYFKRRAVHAPRLDAKRVSALKTNYFRCETQFMSALQTISSKLMTVPIKARLAALRVEIAMLNRDLPAEVDIPLLIPSTPSHSDTPKLNKIVRISPGEAVLLNSAARVPYLLLIEYLRNEVDFDPHSEQNKQILNEDDRRHIFDIMSPISLVHSPVILVQEHDDDTDSTDDEVDAFTTLPPEERDMGDLSILNLYGTKRDAAAQETLTASLNSISRNSKAFSESESPRSSDLSFAPAYSFPIADPPDIDELVTQMRTAAVMITQLDNTNVLPQKEVARIKAKIAASMQSMEEHTMHRPSPISEGKTEAGDRKMENDLKTTGMDGANHVNTLALGEEWLVRKERIRKESPFGHLPNWDLFSVIVKTGDDLRQEAFACQLIQAMQMVWEKAGAGVWVKKYNILTTHHSAGLVETITNTLSIHSIKKSMSAPTIKNGKTFRGRIATLSDFFDLVSCFTFQLTNVC